MEDNHITPDQTQAEETPGTKFKNPYLTTLGKYINVSSLIMMAIVLGLIISLALSSSPKPVAIISPHVKTVEEKTDSLIKSYKAEGYPEDLATVKAYSIMGLDRDYDSTIQDQK
jgi:hypothetical protein